MITEELINAADKKVRSLYVENKMLRLWVYISLGISNLFGLILMYFSTMVSITYINE
jgi:hypothetical protein